ncbi:MAG: class I SAM-dependent methyltransferase [Planctomycetales bacterium]|nr:class I SAM-dependent methyltransferase [Planctomycetales bacterium]
MAEKTVGNFEPQRYAWNADQYALLDFGRGRKLERFGGCLLDRPSPAAVDVPSSVGVDWSQAAARLDERGRLLAGGVPADWQARCGRLVFNLKLTPFGHLGLFPEQAANWQWLYEQLSAWTPALAAPPRALNLFAYTGGSTMLLSAAGAEVVHVDASVPAVNWARRNAQDSGLSDRPIRWIVEDARKFVARELRRGNTYNVIVLDPPSYGHGPRGSARWEIASELPELLDNCLRLLGSGPARLLLTAHSGEYDERRVADFMNRRGPEFRLSCGRLQLGSTATRLLDAGYFVRAARA